nr:C39 family peptidase [Phaeacidiphilus oryzae]
MTIRRPDGTAKAEGGEWEYQRYTLPHHRPPLAATQLIASWNADTPTGTWIEVRLRADYPSGGRSPWYTMGRWARTDADIRRTSVTGQGDGRSRVSTDVLELAAPSGHERLTGYQLQLVLYRRPGLAVSPRVRRAAVCASAVPDRFEVPAGAPGLGGRAVELALPRYSQELHRGEYPEYDGGGEAWCSPSSTEMAVEYWGCRPTPAELAWVRPDYADPQVDHAARSVYDAAYRGCGNWPFNAAYAASYGLNAAVTRLHSLNDVERLVDAGIPVITSQSFRAAELDGSGYDTAGHLMAVAGFTADGDVVAHDPAAPDDPAVRRVYRRRQFETVWLRTLRHRADGSLGTGSGGVVYLTWPAEPTRRQAAALASVGVA